LSVKTSLTRHNPITLALAGLACW